MTVLITAHTDWYCPKCGKTDQTRESRPHSRYHDCPGFFGMSTPMVQQGISAKIETHEREDYIGNDKVQTDSRGRPIMSMVTTKDNGTDVRVYAPTATGGIR